MYKKTFTSISISQHKLKLVRLAGDQKKILKASTYPIPEGLISQGKVQKVDELAGIIKTVWKKEGIRDRSVGIIVPEFSTFMKALTLPKLQSQELDEAVRWQAREFLPIKSDNMVLDWKVIGETPEAYEVLTVAVETGVLFGFVDAVNKAGLFPLVVETPSLCLERLAEAKDKGKLAIYRSHGVVVATVISGKKILASSVVAQNSEEGLLRELIQIQARFGKNTISSVAVCGNGLTQEFLNALQQKLQLPVELLKLGIVGLSDMENQDYIIALSQQLIDPEEPANSDSINLLPPVWVSHYKKELRDLRAWTISLVASVVLWSCLLVALATYMYLSQQEAVLTEESKPTSSTTDALAITTQVATINALSTKVNKYMNSFSYPQKVVSLIASKKIEGITITGYEVNTETGKAAIRGTASSRSVLISFKESLEQVPNFIRVNLPLESLLIELNVPFEISMDYTQTK